ncbi:RNA-directed DNA polymerase, eukaryota [Tanacetum coccineum]
MKDNKKEDLEDSRSEDPFKIYDILEKNLPKTNVLSQTEVESKYPPGFTPANSSDIGQDNHVHGTIEKEHGDKQDFKKEAALKEEDSFSGNSGHFKTASFPKTGGSMLYLIEELIKVGQVMGYKMEGCMNDIEEIETKMENVDLFDIRSCWGNLSFDYVWTELLIISVYAPQELSEKKSLWQYLVHVIDGWNGAVIIMGDFNEVHTADERFGSIFNNRGAAAFNSFISAGGLVEVSLGGYSFTWVHKSATKMSKLDRFLISEDLMSKCPNVSSIILDKFLSDHRPILLRELSLDYGPLPFRFFHHWFEIDGFDSFVSEAWKGINVDDSNDMLKLAKKLKILKGLIRSWVKDKKDKASILKNSLKKKIADIDALLDNEIVSPESMADRSNAMNDLINLEKIESIELAQKAKLKWSIEGDENSKIFHGCINKKRNNMAIRGVIVDGQWIEDPLQVKKEFLSHFKERFYLPSRNRLMLDMVFPNTLSSDQSLDLERPFSPEEIKGAVWDCGSNKSPGPDGFTFDFYRKFWYLIEENVVAAVNHFYLHGYCQKGSNSSFIALIPKYTGAKMVKDFRPISLIGSLYKIIAKLLANRLVTVVGALVNEVQSAFIANRQILDGPFILNEIINWCNARKKQSMIFKVDFEKAFDSVRWDFLDDILMNFGFGSRWRFWIQSCLKSSRGSILVNGSPTSEFQFHKAFSSFYADDVVFLGQWSNANLSTIIHVLECFFRASGLRINLHKSKLIGITVDSSVVHEAANKIGCMATKLPFPYLGINIGDRMSRIKAWDNVIEKVLCRLSKWKMKSLSIGGRLTLLKSVLGSTPLYYMSMYKVPIQVLNKLESIRYHFLNGVEHNVRKMLFVKWKNVLASKEKGGLGEPSFYGLNRALIFKWIWRFRLQNSSIWSKVIQAIHGVDVVSSRKPCFLSNWYDINQITPSIQKQGIDLLDYMQRKLGNGEHTRFWEDPWKGSVPLKILFPRIFSLEMDKSISVASKLADCGISYIITRGRFLDLASF